MVHLFDSRVFRDSVLLCPAAKRRLSHFRHNCIYPRDSAVEKQAFYPPRTRVFSGRVWITNEKSGFFPPCLVDNYVDVWIDREYAEKRRNIYAHIHCQNGATMRKDCMARMAEMQKRLQKQAVRDNGRFLPVTSVL
jgi:hypothetical protein